MPFHKQPIVHFILIGILIFAVYGWLNPGDSEGNGKQIVVDESSLLEYLQYRNGAFNPASARSQLAVLSDSELKNLKSRLIREEALYREGLKLQMDQSDYVIKQRMVQKMEYLAQGFQKTDEDLSSEEVERYFQENRQSYHEPATLTFTHVFIDPERQEGNVQQRANSLLTTLREQQVPFSQATRHGDRFLYHANYVKRPADFVDSHFGADFAEQVMALKPDTGLWQGPIASSHGLHIVKVAQRQPGRIPPLTKIYDRVAQDARAARMQAQTEEAIRRIVDSYEVIDRVTTGAAETDAVAARK